MRSELSCTYRLLGLHDLEWKRVVGQDAAAIPCNHRAVIHMVTCAHHCCLLLQRSSCSAPHAIIVRQEGSPLPGGPAGLEVEIRPISSPQKTFGPRFCLVFNSFSISGDPSGKRLTFSTKTVMWFWKSTFFSRCKIKRKEGQQFN